MRTVGLEAAAIDAATPGELMANHVMMTAVAGEEFGRLWTWGNHPARLGEYATASPCTGCDLPQDRFEPLLVGEAARLGTHLRMETEFVGLEQDADGVTTTLRDLRSDETLQVRSRYVIGADGGQSRVADAIGLPLDGTSGLANALNVRFTADLSRHVAHRPGSLYWILQPDRDGALGNAMLRMVRPWFDWVVGFVHLGATVADLSPDEIAAQVRSLIQDDSVEVTVQGVYPWKINHVIAQHYSVGRVFCGGDAVHRHPPMNGLGGNTCIQDAFNLAWKIAAVLNSGADPALLDTYSLERQPVGRQVVDRAIASWRQNPEVIQSLGIDPKATPAERQLQFAELQAPTPAGEERRRAFARAAASKDYSYHAHGVEMNQVYASGAVIADPEPFHYDRDAELYYQPTTYPGARLPHCWVAVAGRTVSTLDLTGPEQLTLITGVQGEAWLRAAEALQPGLAMPLVALRIGPGGEVTDLYRQWAELADIDETGCLLVRPDQHIAWRCRSMPTDPESALREVLSQALRLAVRADDSAATPMPETPVGAHR
jgi:2,4-dichlorophenol 6-monooxygenase